MGGAGRVRTAFVFVVFAVMALLLQTALLPRVAPGRMTPDLLLILVVYLGLHHHSARAAGGAFLLGYLQDVSSAGAAGLNAFAACAVYLVVYLTSRRLWVDNTISKIVVVLLAAGVKTVAVVALLLAFVSAEGVARATVATLLLQGALAAALSPFAFGALRQALSPRAEEDR